MALKIASCALRCQRRSTVLVRTICGQHGHNETQKSNGLLGKQTLRKSQ